MPDTIVPSLPAKKHRRGFRWLAGSVVALLFSLVAAYLVTTSSGFLKAVILPRVSDALNARVTVSDAKIHPFSGIILRDLKVQSDGQPAVLTADEFCVSYHLFDILGGNFHVDEIALVSPTVELVQNPDGSRNLDSILKALQAPLTAKKKPAPTAKVSEHVQIDLAKLTVSHATILQTKNYADGRQDFAALTNVSLTLTNLKNGQTAELDLAADVRVENNSATNGNNRLAASLKGNFNLSLNPDLKPGSASGNMNFSVSQASGALSSFEAFGTTLDCDVTPMEIKQLALRFQKAGVPLGELTVAGPFDAEKMEGKLDVALHGIDRRLLNLIGARSGLDFDGAQIDSTNEIELAKAGVTITATGRLNAKKIQLTRAGQTTPPIDFRANYDVTVDRAAERATLSGLDLTGTQNGAPLLNAQLTSPMSLAWGGGTGGNDDAAFNLTVAGLNLADWKPFFGDLVSGGKVGLKLKVCSHRGGKQIGFDLNTDVSDLVARVGRNQISQAEVILDAHAQATEFKRISLSDYKLQVALQNQPVLKASGSGNFDLATGEADAKVKLSAMLARLPQVLPLADVGISSGILELNAQVTQNRKAQTLAGDLTLTNFDGQIGKNAFAGYSSLIKLDVANSPAQIQINQVAGTFSQNGNAGGNFNISGTYQPAQKSADVSVKLAGVNENALRPFLDPLLGGKQLVSVAVNGTVSGQYNPSSASAVKANVRVANLIINDPAKKFPAAPLSVGLLAEASLNRQTVDVRQLQIALTPTGLATNQLDFTGQVDFSKTNEIQGNLKLAADSLDLTGYYDLFTGGTKAATEPATTKAPASANPGQEPPAVHLPLQNFTLAADIRRLYLHELAISNLETSVEIDSGHVVLRPSRLMLNGAPVAATADVNLGVPGYQYNVTFDAQAIPLVPLLDTFAPARAGQMGGTLSSDAQIKGAGVTGASLQKNLAGKFNLNMTNLNLSVINVHSAILKAVINVVATVPELISNPANAITSLLGDVTGRGGLMNEMQQAPIQVISMRGTAGNGLVDLQSAAVQSAAFEVNAAGGVTLDSVLTNSTINVPVSIALSQAIAKELNLATAAPSTNTAYVPLPQFLTMAGTIGNPKTDVSKLALAGVAIQSVGGGLLNPSGSNTSPVGNLLNQFLRLGK